MLSVPAPGVLADDTDPEGKPLTAVLVSGFSNKHASVSLNLDGSFDLRVHKKGTYTFTYKVSDGALESNTATVSITTGKAKQTDGHHHHHKHRQARHK